MKRVYLLRHAKSSWKEPALPDHDRPLTGRGRQAAKAIARHLSEQHELRLGGCPLSRTALRDSLTRPAVEWDQANSASCRRRATTRRGTRTGGRRVRGAPLGWHSREADPVVAVGRALDVLIRPALRDRILREATRLRPST